MEPVTTVSTAPDDTRGRISHTRCCSGTIGQLGTVLAAGLSLYALYWVVGIVQPFVYRVTFLLLTLVLSFLFYPAGARDRERASPQSTGPLIAAHLRGARLADRRLREFHLSRQPIRTSIDVTLGIVAIVVVLEATRRTTG